MAAHFRLGIFAPDKVDTILKNLLDYLNVDAEITIAEPEEDVFASAIGCSISVFRLSGLRDSADYYRKYYSINPNVLIDFRLGQLAEPTKVFPVVLGYILKYMEESAEDFILSLNDRVLILRRSGELFINKYDSLWTVTNCLEMFQQLDYSTDLKVH